MTELITRQFVVREVDDEARTVAGIAVPFNQTISVGGGISERFEAGAIDSVENVKLFYGHAEPIGLVTKGEDTEDGFHIEARISATPRGDEIYTLLKDGVLNKFSVGFVPVEDRLEDDDTTIVRTKVDLKEVSVVPFPAYDGASVLAVREDGSKVRNNELTNSNERGSIESTSTTNMTDNFATVADLDEVRNNQAALDRAIADLSSARPASDAAVSQFRSAGEAVKALVSNDSAAAAEFRAVATTANSHAANDWKGILVGIAQGKRPLVNVFGTGPLGASGNTVEFGTYTVTGAAGSQVAQGDVLSDLYISTGTATAAVKTYGVKSELSRQVIERSDISFLDGTLQAQAATYAVQTNAYVRSILTGATPVAGAGFTLASATGKDVFKAVVDGVQKIDALNLGWSADAVIVSADVFLSIASMGDSNNRPVFDVAGDGANTFGKVAGLSASIFGVPVVLDSALAAKSMYIVSKNAIGVWENAGAPVALSDENILTLVKSFSLYGYLASGVVSASAIVKPAIA